MASGVVHQVRSSIDKGKNEQGKKVRTLTTLFSVFYLLPLELPIVVESNMTFRVPQILSNPVLQARG